MTNGEEEKGTEAEEPQADAENKVMHSSVVCPLRKHVCYNVRNFQRVQPAMTYTLRVGI